MVKQQEVEVGATSGNRMAGSPISWLMILKLGKEVCSKGQQAGRTPHARQRSGAFTLLNGRPKGAWTAGFDELGSEWWVAGLFKANRRRRRTNPPGSSYRNHRRNER